MKHTIETMILGLLFCMSCKEQSSDVEVTRIIKNETQKNLQILVYKSQKVAETLDINKMDSYTTSSVCYYEFGKLSDCDLIWSLQNRNDSVHVVFEDQRILSYCGQHGCIRNEKNIMDLSLAYEDRLGYKKIKENTYLFTITEEDYLLAE